MCHNRWSDFRGNARLSITMQWNDAMVLFIFVTSTRVIELDWYTILSPFLVCIAQCVTFLKFNMLRFLRTRSLFCLFCRFFYICLTFLYLQRLVKALYTAQYRTWFTLSAAFVFLFEAYSLSDWVFNSLILFLLSAMTWARTNKHVWSMLPKIYWFSQVYNVLLFLFLIFLFATARPTTWLWLFYKW